MADDEVVSVGARLEGARQAREQRAREAIWKELGPGVLRLAKEVLPEQPGVQRELAQAFADFGVRVAIAVAQDAELLRELGPSRALVLDGEGKREVIDAPAMTPILDVDKVLQAVRAVEREAETLKVKLPRGLALAILDLSTAMGRGR
jgi:hypothetical protein